VIAQYWWLDPSRALAAQAQGAQMIASPATHAYLDIVYDETTPVGSNWAGTTDVRDAYEWDPVIEGVKEGDVIGIEAPLWGVGPLAEVEFMMFPRLLGHAEIGWSAADGRSWEGYRQRLGHHGARLDAWEVSFHRSALVDWGELPSSRSTEPVGLGDR
jgi:hexosaminidase